MNDARRKFVKNALVLSAFPGAAQRVDAADKAPAGDYESMASVIWQPGFERRDGLLDTRELVRLGTLAASSHNAQPWKFKVGETSIRILPDLKRRCPVVDPDDSHLFKSLGCAAENIAHAATAQGHYAHITFDRNEDAVVINLERSRSVTTSALFHAIALRQCVRAEYEKKPIARTSVALMERAASGPGVTAIVLSSKAELNSLAEYVRQGDLAQYADAAYVNELRDWIRFNPAEALERGDGLASLVTDQPSIPSWLGRVMFRFVVSGSKQAVTDAKHIASSSGALVIVGDRNDRESWVEAGRVYERFALQAAALGIRNAFINQPIEVRSLRTAFHTWLNVPDRYAHLIVRFGHGPTVPHSLRRPLTDVIT
jgi:hypothetical protein